MKKQDGVWVKSESPYVLASLTDVSVINDLIGLSTYISKTELATGEQIVNLEISTTTLVKMLEGIEVDLDDPVNSIELKKNENGEVVQIKYNLDSYAKYKGLAINEFRLNLDYSNFGDIKEFKEPV